VVSVHKETVLVTCKAVDVNLNVDVMDFDCEDGAAVVYSSTRAESSNSIFPTLGYMFSMCSRRMWFGVSLLGKVWLMRSVFMCAYLMSPLHIHELQLGFTTRLQRTGHIFFCLCACSVLCGIVWECYTLTFTEFLAGCCMWSIVG
jgi:hypothetical protein